MNPAADRAGWVTNPLVEVATLQRGYDLPVQDRAPGEFPIFAANGPVGFHAVAKCKGPGVVTGRSGTIGKVHFVQGDYWPLNTSLYVTDFHGNDPKWVYYMLQAFGLERFSQGAGVPTLNRNLVHGEPIRVPPLPEQRRIAAILDKADALRTKRREALAQLDCLTHSIFLEMFGDPSVNPKRWPMCNLGQLVQSASDGPHVSPQYSESGIPFLSTRHVRPGEISWSDLKFISLAEAEVQWKKCKPLRGDILYTKGGTTGYAAEVRTDEPFAVWVHVALLKPNRELCNPTWLEAMLNSAFCYRQSQELTHGIANRDLGLKRMVKIQMYSPPLSQQNEFVRRIDSLNSLRARHKQCVSSEESLFSVLQHHAFLGDL